MSAAQHTAGPWGIHTLKVLSKPVAAMELSKLVEGTKGFSGVLPMVVAANGLCVAVTGCGPDGVANARSIAAAVNACEGIPIEVLEANAAGGLPFSVADQIDMRVLISKLRAAAEKVEPFLSGFDDDNTQDGVREMLRDLRAAIDLAKRVTT